MLVSNLANVNWFKSKPPKSPALIFLNKNGGKITYSWEDYKQNAIWAATGLKDLGVRENDFVAIIPLNLPESFFVLLGIMLIGAIPVPINPQLVREPGLKELKSILNDSKPKLFLANYCLEKYLKELSPFPIGLVLTTGKFSDQDKSPSGYQKRSDLQRLLVMPYTSGTTGGPKGVMLSHGNIIDRVGVITQVLRVNPKDRLLSYLSLGHISELIATFFSQMKAGYTVYFTEHAIELIEDKKKFKKAFPSILQSVKPTVFLAVPKVWQNIRKEIEEKTKHIPFGLGDSGSVRNLLVRLIKNRLGLNKTRCFISAGSKIGQDDKNFFASMGIYIDDIYGQTETGGPLTINGKILGDARVYLGEENEILVEGPNVMMGYYKRPKQEGPYHTGDVGTIGQEENIHYNGRLGDGFKNSQGEFISPGKVEELEEAVRKIDGVEETIVCGADKPYNIALVFSSRPSEELRCKLEAEITQIGQGMYRIRKILLLNSAELEFTPTLKIKKKAMLKKFEKEINEL
ncbi:MAG: hypothetical protein A2915_03995 [Candidatus Yanofskybacteria bacterium RIFCSPLOWO2_01_FULL_41_34]|uniref:AMP-dependent synthetase/ligase domain-containing protein n=1 Tax=Candidatus Yanofskybacteria bacterium RIFCSPHIGHO2_01_FULL_41_26 TaxID=1802661 RepID=A0A1F8EBF6_9BACT|nr:MAG: hypothetical protein A2649_03090 [Candidatus Yanofskybacteria bacterium RIFCSPHIGHO2_01_FULL_41_26]OGN21572.1 MAG: hypothetical protein A2915_03995 [Candidatus Yanofskybacteria bacterium RIFCSPLOWO2_01_FULL_41_34]